MDEVRNYINKLIEYIEEFNAGSNIVEKVQIS